MIRCVPPVVGRHPPRDAAVLESTREPRFGIGTIRRWALERIAEAVQGFLDTGDRAAIGDPDTLRAALERLEAYNAFQPDRFDRRVINARFRHRATGA